MCGVLRRAISTKTTAFSKVRLKTANGEIERKDKIKEGIKDVVDICNNGTYRRKWGRRSLCTLCHRACMVAAEPVKYYSHGYIYEQNAPHEAPAQH